MADKDQFNDEYQFADLDAINPSATDDIGVTEETTKSQRDRRLSPDKSVKRNALIVVVLVILAMVIYKFLGAYFSEKKLAVKPMLPTQTKNATVVPIAQPKPSPQPIPQAVQPFQPVQSGSVSTQYDPKIEQKLSALELSQQTMRSEVASVNNQLGGVNTNVNALSAQITQLNETIATLAAKVDAQSNEIIMLTKPKKPKITRVIRRAVPVTRFYIQAVIPGRAWLIARNGATLTVREGTSIPGYGTVTLIDPNQGRITTSSGQVIRFSQEDS